MRIIFLDIDGVLWTVPGDQLAHKHNIKHGTHCELDPTRVILLERILEKHPDVKIVVSSTWRYGRTVEELAEILGPIIGPRVIDKTPIMREKNGRGVQRSREIQYWLKHIAETITDYVILDDDADMIGEASHWWKCDAYDGMSSRTAFLLEDYLKMRPDSYAARKIRLTNWLRWATIIVKYYSFRSWYWPLTWRVQDWLRKRKRS